MMFRLGKSLVVVFVGLMMSSAANAVLIVVDAKANSTSGGVGASTGVNLIIGDSFSVSAAAGDLWSAGALPRWSNADGIDGPDLIATGSDDSGEAAGTVIGRDQFGDYTQNGVTAPFGTLVGSISGSFFAIGTNFAGNAVASGELLLWYHDVNNGDNSGSILATVSVPEPGTLGLLGLGLLGLAFARRKTT